jgi:hypothetical protein
LLFAGLLYLVQRAIRRSLLDLVGTVSSVAPRGDWRLGASGLDAFLLMAGLLLSAATGSLWLYGVVQRSAQGAVGSRVAAVLITSVAGALMWSPAGGLAVGAAVFAGQLLLCGAALVGGRVWPLAAAAGSHLVRWVLLFSR